MNFSVLITSLLLISSAAFAADEKVSENSASNETNPLRCEKFNEGGISTLKEKLGLHCNLDKPYSISVASTIAHPDGFYYCCHKK